MTMKELLMEWIKKCPIRGKTYFYTTKEKAIDAINNKDPVCVIYIKKEKIGVV